MTTPACKSNAYPLYLERSARLQCAVAPSRLLSILLLLICLQALSLIWWSHVSWLLSFSLVLLVAAFSAREWQRLQGCRGVLSTRERRWFWRGEGLAERGNREEREFDFRGELVLWSWLVVINARDLRGKRLRLVLASDSMARDDWRRLQAALRFSR